MCNRINYQRMWRFVIAIILSILSICLLSISIGAITIENKTLFEIVLEANPSVRKLSEDIPIGENVIQPSDLSYNCSDNINSIRSTSNEFEKELLSSHTLYTTDGSSFNAYRYSDWTEAEGKAFHEDEVEPEYTQLTGSNIKDYPTFKYNCHSYAWYNNSTNNQYVIEGQTNLDAFYMIFILMRLMKIVCKLEIL